MLLCLLYVSIDDKFNSIFRHLYIHVHFQVDALKAKLATQEIELQKKNEEADKLIRIVEAETAKVKN